MGMGWLLFGVPIVAAADELLRVLANAKAAQLERFHDGIRPTLETGAAHATRLHV